MWRIPALALVFFACARPAPPRAAADVSGGAPAEGARPTAADEERAQYATWVDELERALLERGTVPAPVVSFDPQTHSDGGLVITVVPALPEAQPWNAWPDGSARLFNDGIGYLWRISLASDRAVRWSPAHTQLAVNDTEQTFLPALQPDDLLVHLVRGAALETRAGRSPNLSLRVRNADEFRRAYLGTDPSTGPREGVLVFPAPSRTLQAVAMELTLGVWVEGDGVRQYRFLFE